MLCGAPAVAASRNCAVLSAADRTSDWLRSRHNLERHARHAAKIREPVQHPGKRQDEDRAAASSKKCQPASGLTTNLRWLMLIAALASSQHVVALDGAAKPSLPFTVPLPPPRPESRSVTQGTATSSPAAPALVQPAPQQETPRQPRYLPPASRARMHACGQEWQKLKETGLAADKTWFEFAQVCLAK
jgi:hypothetical protein